MIVKPRKNRFLYPLVGALLLHGLLLSIVLLGRFHGEAKKMVKPIFYVSLTSPPPLKKALIERKKQMLLKHPLSVSKHQELLSTALRRRIAMQVHDEITSKSLAVPSVHRVQLVFRLSNDNRLDHVRVLSSTGDRRLDRVVASCLTSVVLPAGFSKAWRGAHEIQLNIVLR